MNPQYEILAKCLLPTHMLEWFELTNVEVKPKENTATQDTQSEESPVNIIHLYLDENNLTPDNREDLRPNGFTPAKTFHDFPIRGQEVLLHVRRRRCWLDTEILHLQTGQDFRLIHAVMQVTQKKSFFFGFYCRAGDCNATLYTFRLENLLAKRKFTPFFI